MGEGGFILYTKYLLLHFVLEKIEKIFESINKKRKGFYLIFLRKYQFPQTSELYASKSKDSCGLYGLYSLVKQQNLGILQLLTLINQLLTNQNVH